MTAFPQPPPTRPLTVAEFTALGEDDDYRWAELQEGALVMSPSPTPDHMLAVGELRDQLKPQLPPGVRVISEVNIDLRLAPTDQPGTARIPDLIIDDQDGIDRVRAEGGMLRASEVRLAVEIVSPGSRRMDHVVKRGEYADAGIGHYWIVDLDKPVSLLACHLAGELGYADDGERTGTFTTTRPYPLTIDLDQLT
ncbi:Uma2 family endonuclease [Pseudonocardia acaciae]|uniref:Uma2 family endonuclease n=1 Tax=Pseudonocardia acaciae TaxID=551276 RepID=UPI00049044DE|nr:Uma2 family endonuclease [Pseudonocardia acaciae]